MSKPKKKEWYSSPWKIILVVFAVLIILPIVATSVNRATDPTQTPEAKQAKTEADEQQQKQEAARVYQETVDTYAPIYCANHQDITVNESTLDAQGWPMADNQKGITEDECRTLIGLLYAQREGYSNQTAWIKSVSERKVAIGMTKIEVVYAWGSPNDINKTTSSGGTWEQWVFGNPIYGANYVYFDNDLVTSIQN